MRPEKKKQMLIDSGKCAICGNTIYHKKTLCSKHQKMYFKTKDKLKITISMEQFITQEREKIFNNKVLFCISECNIIGNKQNV